MYDCYGITTTIARFEDAPSVADLHDHPGAAAFAALTDDLDSWRAVVVENTRLGAIRELDPPDVVDGEVRDHERMAVELIGAAALPGADEDRWEMTSAGPCVLRADLGDLGAASVFVDGDGTVDPQASNLHLLVVEQNCASGQSATGRVHVDVNIDAGQIGLVVGVEPRGGDQTCQGNPTTPVTVELHEPVGDRRVVDASRYPNREIEGRP